MACRGCRPASFRSRTRAICSSPCNCLTAPRSTAPSTCSTRSAKSPARRRASIRSSPLPAFRRSTTRSSLANAGVAYLILKDWSARGPGEDLRSLFVGLNEKLAAIEEARILVLPPPPIQGIGNAAGFAMQVEAARRQLRFRQAAGDHQRHGRQCADAERAAARQFAVPLDGAAVRRRGRPGQDPDAACHDRPGILDAGVLYGLDLCQPVQQVRPHLPGLCAGGCAVPPDAARHREPDGAQQQGRHDPARHGGDDHARRSALADQPLQPLSVRDRSSACRPRASAPASRWR